MEILKCPKLDKCPIFQKNVFHNELIGKTYRNLYCETIENRFLKCKRYLISEKYKKEPPESILPNSTLSIDEIAQQMGLI